LDCVSERLTYQLTDFVLNLFFDTVINFASWIKRNFEVTTFDIPGIFGFMDVVVIVEVFFSAVLYDVFVSAPVGVLKLVAVLFIVRTFLVVFTALRTSLLANVSYYSVALAVLIDSLVIFLIVSLIFLVLVRV